LRQLRTTPVGRFALFVSLMTFAVNLSAPLLAPFILKDLGFGYAPFMAVVTSASLSAFIFQAWWGAYGDLTGNARMLKAAGWGITVIPLFWMVSRNFYWLLGVQFVAGCFWGGFTLLIVNFMLQALPPERRIRAMSYFNVMTSVAVVLGSVTGVLLLHHLPPLFGHSFLALFLISCFLRVVVMMTAARAVRETRELV
jgi:MFS family permease